MPGCMHIRIHIYVDIYTHIHTYSCVFTYIHIYIFTYTYIYIYSYPFMFSSSSLFLFPIRYKQNRQPTTKKTTINKTTYTTNKQTKRTRKLGGLGLQDLSESTRTSSLYHNALVGRGPMPSLMWMNVFVINRIAMPLLDARAFTAEFHNCLAGVFVDRSNTKRINIYNIIMMSDMPFPRFLFWKSIPPITKGPGPDSYETEAIWACSARFHSCASCAFLEFYHSEYLM
jgi:hypothetical protein